jgi:hypothetical protein
VTDGSPTNVSRDTLRSGCAKYWQETLAPLGHLVFPDGKAVITYRSVVAGWAAATFLTHPRVYIYMSADIPHGVTAGHLHILQ